MWQKQGQITATSGAELHLYSTSPKANGLGVVQINHGLAEHAERYAHFAEALAAAGFHAYAHDHRGHGKTTAPDGRQGLFASEGGVDLVLSDVDDVHNLIAERHPDLPIITFGHSMGGLIALNYAMRHPSKSAGLAVWNSNFSAGILGEVGKMLLRFEKIRLGHDVPSRIGPKMTFDTWAKSIPDARTPYDWLSRDAAEVDAYIADPHCGWDASVAMWLDLMALIFAGANDTNLGKLPRELPILLRGGGADPATNNGKAVRELAGRLKKLNFSDVTTIIDPDMRHESLNEEGREQVIAQFIAWARQAITTTSDK